MIVGALVSVESLAWIELSWNPLCEAQSYVFKTMLSLGLTEIIRGSSQRWYQSHTDCRLEIALALVLVSLLSQIILKLSNYFQKV